ncbi:MAG TPA: hypothetical protein VK007_11730 [Acidimicrobiales bacterium]|nr:hypothetical protein [Acidimicrobiales bacterium]
MSTTAPVSANGQRPVPAEAPASGGPLARLRQQPRNVHLFRGYGPLVVGAVLFALMVLLAPSVAPERTVERPAGGTPTTAPVDEAPPPEGGSGPEHVEAQP